MLHKHRKISHWQRNVRFVIQTNKYKVKSELYKKKYCFDFSGEKKSMILIGFPVKVVKNQSNCIRSSQVHLLESNLRNHWQSGFRTMNQSYL